MKLLFLQTRDLHFAFDPLDYSINIDPFEIMVFYPPP